MRALASLLSLALVGCASFGETQDTGDLCNKLFAFDRAPFAQTAKPDGLPDRWIEIHWRGKWLDLDNGWGLTCRHSDDAEATELCGWLLDGRTPFEFADGLSFEILSCHGYVMAGLWGSWNNWKASIDLHAYDRWVTLDTDFPGWTKETKETGAMRYSVYRDDDSPWAHRPPLAPLKPDDGE